MGVLTLNGENMEIAVFDQPSGLNGAREVWVRVRANEAHDWRYVESKMDADQHAQLKALGSARTMRFFPFPPEPVDSDHSYLFEDFFVWSKVQ